MFWGYFVEFYSEEFLLFRAEVDDIAQRGEYSKFVYNFSYPFIKVTLLEEPKEYFI